MKRRAAALLPGFIIGTALMLTSCTEEVEFPDIDRAVSFKAQFSGKISGEAEVTRYGEKDWQITFLSPHELQGITVINGKTAVYDGISSDIRDTFLTDGLTDGFDAAADYDPENKSERINIKSEDGGIIFKYSNSAVKDSSDGFVLRVTPNGEPLEFSNNLFSAEITETKYSGLPERITVDSNIVFEPEESESQDQETEKTPASSNEIPEKTPEETTFDQLSEENSDSSEEAT